MDTGDSDGIGQINIQNFQSIIKNYEVLIKELTSELNVFKLEQNNLQQKIHRLVNENNDLSNKLKESEEKTQELLCETVLVQNLKEQLDLLSQEKNSLHGLWQKSLQNIHHLEEELKYFNTSQERVPIDQVNKIKNTYEQKIKSLNEELSVTKKQFEQYIKNSGVEIEKKNYELVKTMNTQTNTFKIVRNLEGEILKLQERLEDTATQRNSLEKKLRESNLKIEKLERENNVCLLKVTEALQVAEASLNEKDGALLRENEAKGEIEKLTNTLSDIVTEAAEKVKNEVESVKSVYNNKLGVLISDLKSLEDEVRIKNLELEKCTNNCKYLQEKLNKLEAVYSENRNEDNVSKLIHLETTLESVFQKYLVSERKNIQLVSEKDNIKHDLEQMGNYYERDIKSRNIERATLQNKITKLQDECQELHIQIENLTKIITEKEDQEKLQINEKVLKAHYMKLIQDLEKEKEILSKELQRHLESQLEINKKWKAQYKIVTVKFEKCLQQLKLELTNLKRENKKLKKKLLKASSKFKEYKKFLWLITNDVKNIVDVAESDKIVL